MSTLEFIDWISYIVGAVLASAWGILSFRRARKRKDNALLFYLLAGFYACVAMCNTFYLLTWIVEDYPFVLSPGDLSWVGSIAFLITIALALTDKWTPDQQKAAKKYRLPALIAPAVCLAFNIAYINIYPDIIINYLLYGIPTAILSYYALWLFIAGCKDDAQPAMRYYHLVVLAWVAIQLFYDLFSSLGLDYGYVVHFLICSWLLTLATTGIYFAAGLVTRHDAVRCSLMQPRKGADE